jgi:hypothetical protein
MGIINALHSLVYGNTNNNPERNKSVDKINRYIDRKTNEISNTATKIGEFARSNVNDSLQAHWGKSIPIKKETKPASVEKVSKHETSTEVSKVQKPAETESKSTSDQVKDSQSQSCLTPQTSTINPNYMMMDPTMTGINPYMTSMNPMCGNCWGSINPYQYQNNLNYGSSIFSNSLNPQSIMTGLDPRLFLNYQSGLNYCQPAPGMFYTYENPMNMAAFS